MTPDEYCRHKAAKSGSSFYYSFMFLPPQKRLAIIALYAFCREVDDAVDEIADPDVAAHTLAWWRQEIDQTFNGTPSHPVGKALQTALAHFELHPEYFHEIIDGMEMDLQQQSYPAFKHLALYCHRVASVVGLLAAEIFGYQNRQTLKYAEKLGLAFQLTNIIRDVREDAERGRIYLPQEDLQRFNVSRDDILNLRQTPALSALLQFEAQRARDLYQEAKNLLPQEDRFNQRTGLIMSAIYEATLDELEHEGFQVMQHRLSLTPLRKLWLAWKTARRERKHAR
jgi:phytoene synthase